MDNNKAGRPRTRRFLEAAGGAALLVTVAVAAHLQSTHEAERDAERRAADGPQFRGYACTQDCSGHIAGYEWAERKGITSRDECSGNSQSFIEGCWAFVER